MNNAGTGAEGCREPSDTEKLSHLQLARELNGSMRRTVILFYVTKWFWKYVDSSAICFHEAGPLISR